MKRNKIVTKEVDQRGITLVALVITVIIMLILAGVTLNIALGENGLFKMARNGVGAYKEKAKEEGDSLTELEKQLGNLITNGSGEQTPQPPTPLPEPIGSDKIAEDLKAYQGKFVDIGLDVDGAKGATNDWEIFYVNEGRIFLIAADYVPTDTLTTWGVIGDVTTLDDKELKKYSESNYKYIVYWPEEPTEFFNLLNSKLVMLTEYTLNSNNSNSIAVSQLLNTEAWSGIKTKATESDYIEFAIGGPTIEMWCEAWNEAVNGDKNGFVKIKPDPKTDGTGYNVKYDTTSSAKLYMNGTTLELTSAQKTALETTYKTFFPHTGENSWNNCYGYWIASPSADRSSGLMRVHCYGSIDRHDYNYYGCSVRPVVCLESGVQLTETAENSGIYNISK